MLVHLYNNWSEARMQRIFLRQLRPPLRCLRVAGRWSSKIQHSFTVFG